MIPALRHAFSPSYLPQFVAIIANLLLATCSAGEFNLEEENFAQRDHHIIVEVLISSWYALLANTDLICYIVVFINQAS